MAAVEKIANNLRLVMAKADARYVAAGDPEELERVIKNFAMEKLAASEAAAREAVEKVAQQMKDIHNKDRVAFYYLVAKYLDKLASV